MAGVNLPLHPLTWLGLFLILLGVALVVIPVLERYVDLSKIPGWLVYTYKSNGFYLVTSPILILLSIISLLVFLLGRAAG